MIPDIFNIIVEILIAYTLTELILCKIILYVNKRFSWLITDKDEKPTLSESGLKKFISHGYDSEFGWVRKPNTFHIENGKEGSTKWTINSIGARTNPNFENLESRISCYGDSFTFCRQVNDDETWECYLSELQHTNILNFGVGNYGLDQTLLRLKREYPKNKTKIVIIGIVPDTISRILSIWKHYYEYGNTFGFKPRFILTENNLRLIKNPIDHESKFFHYEKYLDQIKENDFFYHNKFKKEKIRFPYSITILKNIKRNFSIIYWILLIQIYKKLKKDVSNIEWNPMRTIMRINLNWRIKLYQDPSAIMLLKEIIKEFIKIMQEKNATLVLVFLPQKDDVNFIRKNFHFYKNTLLEIKRLDNLCVIDLTDYLINQKNLDELYSDPNNYGGHFSKQGNKIIANILNEELNKLNPSK